MSRRFDHHVYIVDRGPMVLTLLQAADAISKVHHPKWFIHERVLARKLGITLEQLHGVVQCLREGGVSSSSSNTFCPNPPPYDTKIDIFSGSEDKPLNLHGTRYGRKTSGSGLEPSTDIMMPNGRKEMNVLKVSSLRKLRRQPTSTL